MNKCLNCGKETNNPKFCSRSCSAIYNNLKAGRKRALTYYGILNKGNGRRKLYKEKGIPF